MLEKKSHHSSTSIYCCNSSSRFRISRYQIFLSIITSSYNQACRKSDVQGGRIVKSGRHVMFAHDISSEKDYILRGAAAMAVYLSKFVPYPRRSMESRWMILCVSVVLRRPFRLDNWSSLAIRFFRWWIASNNYPHASPSVAEWSLSSSLLSSYRH